MDLGSATGVQAGSDADDCRDERQDEWRTGDAVVEAALVMDKLWGFGGWEVTQTHDSLRPYLLEETYELLDAIQSGDPVAIREELGDLLLQVLFHSGSRRPPASSRSTTWLPLS